MTDWRKQFRDKWSGKLIFQSKAGDPFNQDGENKYIEQFIESLLEEVINEIPKYPIGSTYQIEAFKQQLKDKYGIK